MAQVFLSYAREDREYAGRIARVLEQSGHSVWWDRRLDGGEEFSAEIEAALDAADVVLVAWSKESVKSRWVRDEAAVGGDSGTLVPVSIDGSMPPMGFRQFHTLDLVGWKGAKRDERTAELLHSVERRVKGTAAPATPAPTPALGAKPRFPRLADINWIWAAAAAAVLIALIAGGLWFRAYHAGQGGTPTKPMMALLAFTTASADPQLRQIASEARDSLSNTLSQSGIPVKLLASAPQSGSWAGDYLISGDFSRDGDKVVGTLHLDQATQGVTLTSYRFEATGEDVRNLPERIGVQIAGNLPWSLLQITDDGRQPADPALIAQLMQSNNFSNDFLQRYQNAKTVAAKAPDMREAQTALAYYTSFILDAFPIDQRAAVVADARRAFDKARELDPRQGDIEGAWCSLHSETLYGECEDHLRAGIARSPDDSWLEEFLAMSLEAVGRFDEAAELEQLSYTHDPYAPVKIGHMLQILELTGAVDDANDLNQKGDRWWPEYTGSFLRNRLMGLLSRDDFHGIGRLAQLPDARGWPAGQVSGPIISALDSKSVPALRRACAAAFSADPNSGPVFLALECLGAFNKLQDEDSAYALADKLYPRRVGRSPAETEQIWLKNPDGGALSQLVTSAAAAPMRRDPRYILLAQRTGLLAYWRSGRPPDFCSKQHEPICAELLKRR
jgi:TolB-like protein/tetratricopeptide (TPR) repeat protein